MKSPTLLMLTSAIWIVALNDSMLPSLGGDDVSSTRRGESLYLKYCSSCHGADGKGNGSTAVYLEPKPRDFTRGIFKFQSTPAGSLPTDDDLLRTVEKGMLGSAMPAWDRLSLDQRTDLVQYVKTFSSRFSEEKPTDIVAVEQEPQSNPSMLQSGKAVYALAGCWMCHGKSGAGDGPSAYALSDDLGKPIRPYNFTRARTFKGGNTPRDIYRTFTTGIGGTPMPGYGEDALATARESYANLDYLEGQYTRDEIEEIKKYVKTSPSEAVLASMTSAQRKALADERRWALVYYVLSLSKSGVSSLSYTTTDHPLKSLFVENVDKFSDPLSTHWKASNPVEIPLIALWQRDTPTDRVVASSVNDGKLIAIRLEWEDATRNDSALYNTNFGDAAALQLPMDPSSDPFFGMGDTSFAVNIWHWKSWWEQDLESFAGVNSAFPNNATDFYPFDVAGGSRAEYFVSKDSAGRISMTWNTGWGSGNLLSAQRKNSSVEDLNAKGFGTLTSQPLDDQNVVGRGVWKDGKWIVVFIRSLASTGHNDVSLSLGQRIPIALAVWDGSLKDRNGQKMVTNWYWLTIGTKH